MSKPRQNDKATKQQALAERNKILREVFGHEINNKGRIGGPYKAELKKMIKALCKGLAGKNNDILQACTDQYGKIDKQAMENFRQVCHVAQSLVKPVADANNAKQPDVQFKVVEMIKNYRDVIPQVTRQFQGQKIEPLKFEGDKKPKTLGLTLREKAILSILVPAQKA